MLKQSKKSMLLNVDLDEQSEEVEVKEQVEEMVIAKSLVNGKDKYSSLLGKGLFRQARDDQEDQYIGVIVHEAVNQINQSLIQTHSILQHPQQPHPTQQMPSDSTILIVKRHSSKLLLELNSETQSDQDSNQEQKKSKQQKSQTQQKGMQQLKQTQQEKEEKEEKQEKEENQKKQQTVLWSHKEKINEEIVHIDVKDINKVAMNSFMIEPFTNNKMLRAFLQCNTNFLNGLWPEYDLVTNPEFMQLCTTKKKMAINTNFSIAVSSESLTDEKGESFLGKLRGNSNNSIYHIYDRGQKPEEEIKNQNNNKSKGSKVRNLLATIKFLPMTKQIQPRMFSVFLVKTPYVYWDLDGVDPLQKTGLDVLFETQSNQEKIWHFQNRIPIFSQAIKGFILNFGGRVQMSSPKNFILEEVNTKNEVLMVGKTSEELYRLDISFPLSPLIGLGICLANLDSNFTYG